MPKPIRCILLVDDDPDDNFLHQIIIEDSGLCETVRVAENGFAALDYLTHPDHPDYLRPDVILLDINMPGMNGFEFMDQYNTLPEQFRSHLVLMMMTTSLNPVDRWRAQGVPDVNGFQSKPLTQAMLQDIVDRHFSNLP